MANSRPTSREEFSVAIVCALELEAEAVLYLFDCVWDKDGDTFGKAPRDPNHYRTGRIGKYNVVLFILPGMGKANAASATSALLSSYTQIQLVLIVGICGGVPNTGTESEILLGDVIINNAIVQFDFGRRYPNGQFHVKNGPRERLNKADRSMSTFLKIFGTQQGKDLLEEGAAEYLQDLQKVAEVAKRRRVTPVNRYRYPGTAYDQLYRAAYVHRHHRNTTCGCNEEYACDAATKESCEQVGCESTELITLRPGLEFRKKLEADNKKNSSPPIVHIGAMASGDTVMKSGEDRDRIAKQEDIIAFEMEGAGVWEQSQISFHVW